MAERYRTVYYTSKPCPQCGGYGLRNSNHCGKCGGTGRIESPVKVKMTDEEIREEDERAKNLPSYFNDSDIPF